MDVVLDSIQSGASKRVEAPTRRVGITPVAQEPDFVDQEDELKLLCQRVTRKTISDDRKPDPSAEDENSASEDSASNSETEESIEEKADSADKAVEEDAQDNSEDEEIAADDDSEKETS